ncbi:MAG: NYN domain-containing protein [Chloroflexi bacterium CFX7]|nr:NYN domain-containing protein [Chloroflexi bacterium CFX7]
MDLQNRQIERLIHLQEDMAKRIGDGARVAAPPARVGVFVDAANVELAIDRLRTRLDWGKVLRMLTEGRQDHGYKIVTKPLKRFADGSIKANVDIELALDVITMLDRLDIVCVVSGDGDFQRLVEVVQSRGVRVEVVGVGSSVASNLRKIHAYRNQD